MSFDDFHRLISGKLHRLWHRRMPIKFFRFSRRKKLSNAQTSPPPETPSPATATHENDSSPKNPPLAQSPSVGGGGPRIAYLYSVPLIHRMGDVVHEPDVLDTGQELQSLRKTLIESGRRLTFRAEVATVRNFRFLVTLGCRMLHYTGHGNPSCLIFENENGEANPLSVEMLTDLFRAGGVRTQLVFVSACHSESAGHAFAAAGVPHVVAVKFDEKGKRIQTGGRSEEREGRKGLVGRNQIKVGRRRKFGGGVRGEIMRCADASMALRCPFS